MKPFQTIVDEHTTEDEGTDLQAIMEEAAEIMGEPPNVNPLQAMQLNEQHMNYAIRLLGGVVLNLADQMGALPNGAEEEFDGLLLSLEFDKFRRAYELKRAMTEPRLETPGQTTLGEAIGET